MKTYIKPEIKCIDIECANMIAASPQISNEQAWEDGCSKRYSGGFDDDEDGYANDASPMKNYNAWDN